MRNNFQFQYFFCGKHIDFAKISLNLCATKSFRFNCFKPNSELFQKHAKYFCAPKTNFSYWNSNSMEYEMGLIYNQFIWNLNTFKIYTGRAEFIQWNKIFIIIKKCLLLITLN